MIIPDFVEDLSSELWLMTLLSVLDTHMSKFYGMMRCSCIYEKLLIAQYQFHCFSSYKQKLLWVILQPHSFVCLGTDGWLIDKDLLFLQVIEECTRLTDIRERVASLGCKTTIYWTSAMEVSQLDSKGSRGECWDIVFHYIRWNIRL